MSHYEEERELLWPTEEEQERLTPIAQNGNTGDHYPMMKNKYLKELRELKKEIDVYDVLDAFGVENPAVQHAIKKMLAAGNRGYKDYQQDIDEAIQSLEGAKRFPPVPF
ncbi:MAG: hypothetical protein Unbinned96contig1001_23 [Prokaryotic dsDNA virus sp.]|nr:MAG: hypothetical protein Unbinned96contig1001_23 [Prokaryotic dsDNA virus sp.]|tara:strand:+ start:12645 stop:12971 length:327 start_codon:yes stop_codon:yes gene_type:complete